MSDYHGNFVLGNGIVFFGEKNNVRTFISTLLYGLCNRQTQMPDDLERAVSKACQSHVGHTLTWSIKVVHETGILKDRISLKNIYPIQLSR